MKIENIRLEKNGERTRTVANIVWEDCDQPAQEIYYDVDAVFADGVSSNPHAFLVPAVLPAMCRGEKRVKVDEPICPELREGLEVAMAWIHHWYGSGRIPVKIEAKVQSRPESPRIEDRAACFFSGGIDSTATVRRNRLSFPLEHPYSLKDAIIIFGLEVDSPATFKEVLSLLEPVAQDAQLTLLPVYSNIRSLNSDWHFWEFEWESSVYAGVAHALSRRLAVVSIGATYDIPNLSFHGYGSHPLLDHNYGSVDLRVRHDGLSMSRLEKTRSVAQWNAGLQHLRVCNTVKDYRQDTLNCGKCEKCMRTMLALLALGALNKTRAFTENDVTVAMAEASVKIYNPYLASCYQELVAPLSSVGRDDLAQCLGRKLAGYRGELGWRASLRRFDEQVLSGRLLNAKRAVFPRKASV